MYKELEKDEFVSGKYKLRMCHGELLLCRSSSSYKRVFLGKENERGKIHLLLLMTPR